jgi:WXG100 family type VII secretion target
MGGFAVDPAALHDADLALAAAAAHSRARLESLRAAGDDLLGGRWQGGAAAAYRLAWEQWLGGVDAMLTALEQLAVLIGSSGRDYAITDDGVRAAAAASP